MKPPLELAQVLAVWAAHPLAELLERQFLLLPLGSDRVAEELRDRLSVTATAWQENFSDGRTCSPERRRAWAMAPPDMSSSKELTVGIDLASQHRKTAAAAIDWSEEPRVIPLDHLGVSGPLDDKAVLNLINAPGVTKVGIDAPFGWPIAFVDAIAGWRHDRRWPVPPGDPELLQDNLVLRRTDWEVFRVTGRPAHSEPRRGKRPLSVTTDKIAFTAMRCARILAASGHTSLAGDGLPAEVYPDAALREWGIWPADWDKKRFGYKGTTQKARERRQQLIGALANELGNWVVQDDAVVEAWISSDDELDAFICALIARAVATGVTREVSDPECASVKGWIHLPKPDTLGQLASP